MVDRRRLVRVGMLLLSVCLCSVLAGYVGLLAGQAYERNVRSLGPQPRMRNLARSLNEAVGLIKFRSQSGQDRWVVYGACPDVNDGYYIDVGSADGVVLSNTKLLDDLGWKGVCIDPFPTGMDSRTCQTFKEVVYSEAGHKVKFKEAAGLSGIEDHIDAFKEAVQDNDTVELTTTTLDDILERANAPRFIHYMSIDIEGAELEALKGFSFSKYKVGAFTVEHNYEEPKRTEIRHLLEDNGYRYVRMLSQDDCYVLND